MQSNSNLVYDQWLSQICDKSVYKLNIDDQFINTINDTSTLEHKNLKQILAQKVFVFAKIDTSKISHIHFAESLGLRLMDTNVTYEKHYATNHIFNNNCEIRFAASIDEEQTVNVARNSFVYSRFHLDHQFSKSLANEIKAEWVRNYFTGKRGNQMVLAIKDHKVVGFLQLLNHKDNLIIDLIAVDNNYRRMGIANDMIAFAEKKLPQFKFVQVGTQIANVPSLKLYARMGFSIVGSSYVFHYHN